MFYSTDILRKRDGKFGAIWLGAFYGKDLKKVLSRREITRVDITQACTDVLHPTVRFSLRLQANLMVGILRIYKEQVSYFCNEIKHAWRDLRMTLHVDMRLIDLHTPMLSENACTIPDPVNEQILGDFDDITEDIFSVCISKIGPTDNSNKFIHIGFQSPTSSSASSSTHTPPGQAQVSPGPHQARKDQITMSETDLLDYIDEPIQVPEGEDLDGRPLSPLEDDCIEVIDPVTGGLRTEDTGSKPMEDNRPFHDDMVTPSTIIELETPDRPHKKKKQPVDKNRKLSDEKIKRNHLTVSGTLRDQIIDLPLRLSAQELLNNPCRQELRSLPFIDCWRENAVTPRITDEDVPAIFQHEISDDSVMRVDRLPSQPEAPYEPSFEGINIMVTPGSPIPGDDRLLFDVLGPDDDVKLFVGKLFDVIKRPLPDAHSYADDSQLYVSFNPNTDVSQTDAIAAIEHCIEDVKQWMR